MSFNFYFSSIGQSFIILGMRYVHIFSKFLFEFDIYQILVSQNLLFFWKIEAGDLCGCLCFGHLCVFILFIAGQFRVFENFQLFFIWTIFVRFWTYCTIFVDFFAYSFYLLYFLMVKYWHLFPSNFLIIKCLHIQKLSTFIWPID